MPSSSVMRNLARLRARIDQLDSELLKVMSRRAEVVRQVGELKRGAGLPIRVPSREKEILERLASWNPGPLPSVSIQKIFGTLIEECRAYEDQATRASASPGDAPFRVAILGFGLIGGSLGLALRKFVPEAEVAAYDPGLSRHAAALKALGISRLRTPADAFDRDWIFLAMPVGGIVEFLKAEGARVRPGTVVLDVGSTKEQIVREASRRLGPGVAFIGGHPLAGKAVGGFAQAEADLFKGRPFVLVPGGGRVPRKTLTSIEAVLRRVGAAPVRMSAKDHDRMLALTSHLPQLMATALACAAARTLGKRKPLHGPAFAEMTRLARSEYDIWRGILSSNRTAIEFQVKNYQNQLAALERLSRQGRAEKMFRRARRFREQLDKGPRR